MAFIHAKYPAELSAFPEGAVSDQFKSLIKRALKEDQLWVMVDPPKGEKFSGKLAWCNAHTWVNALSCYTEEQLFENPNRLAYAFGQQWLDKYDDNFVYLRQPIFGAIHGTAWNMIFKLLREAGISAAMIYNNTEMVRRNSKSVSGMTGPGRGLVLFNEGDAILAQVIIEENIDVGSRIDFES